MCINEIRAGLVRGVVLAGVLLAVAGRAEPALAAAPRVLSACHISPIVANLDKAAHFYHDLLGLDLVPAPPPGPLPVDDRPEHLSLLGVPGATLRFIGARMPGVFCGIELVELTGVERTPVRRRLQDSGAVVAVLLVRDLDTLFARLKADSMPVVTVGGAPMRLGTGGDRAVVVRDPDGHFVELLQLNPPPPARVPATSQVAGIRLRVITANTDRAVAYYSNALGIMLNSGSFGSNPDMLAMMGFTHGEYRLSVAQLEGGLQLELMEFRGLDPGARVSARVQDPGSYRLQLNVSDIDQTLAAMTAAGSRVVSTGGAPVAMTFGTSRWRLAIAPDPDNLFLIVQQRLP